MQHIGYKKVKVMFYFFGFTVKSLVCIFNPKLHIFLIKNNRQTTPSFLLSTSD